MSKSLSGCCCCTRAGCCMNNVRLETNIVAQHTDHLDTGSLAITSAHKGVVGVPFRRTLRRWLRGWFKVRALPVLLPSSAYNCSVANTKMAEGSGSATTRVTNKVHQQFRLSKCRPGRRSYCSRDRRIGATFQTYQENR
jgi:hypothetical protein